MQKRNHRKQPTSKKQTASAQTRAAVDWECRLIEQLFQVTEVGKLDLDAAQDNVVERTRAIGAAAFFLNIGHGIDEQYLQPDFISLLSDLRKKSLTLMRTLDFSTSDDNLRRFDRDKAVSCFASARDAAYSVVVAFGPEGISESFRGLFDHFLPAPPAEHGGKVVTR